MRPSGPCDESYIREATQYAQRKYDGRNKRIEEVYLRRHQLKKPFVAEPFQRFGIDYRSPLVKDTIRRAKAIISASFPVPRVIPVKAGIRAEDNASKREKWLGSAYIKMDRGKNVWNRLVDSLVAEGEAVWKVYLRTHRWDISRKEGEKDTSYLERGKEQKRAHFPFAWEHVPTTSYYPLASDQDGLAEVLEVTRREAFPLFTQYNLGMNKDGNLYQIENIGDLVGGPAGAYTGSYPDSVEFSEHWNRTHYEYAVNGIIVESGEHGYGRPPYFAAQFDLTSSHDPAYETEGIADVMLHVQDAEDTFVTTLMVWLMLNGQPSARLRREAGEEADPYNADDIVRMESGEMYNGPPGTYPEWTPAPSVSGDFHSLLAKLDQVQDRVALAPILYGEQKDISGPTSTNMITVAKAVFGPGVQSLAHQFDEMAAFIQYQIENHPNLGVPIPIWHEDKKNGAYLELGPDDIDGYYEVEHRIQPSIPMERAQKAIQLAQAVDMGAIDMNMYREDGLELSDPVEVDRRVTVQDLRKSPEWRAMLLQELARLRMEKLKQRGEAPPETPMVGPPGPAPQVQGVQQNVLPGFTPQNSGIQPPLIRPQQPQ